MRVPISRVTRGGTALLVGVVAAGLLLEIAGVLYFLRRDGTLFYSRSRPPEEAPPAELGDERKSVLHPVLGFTRPPSFPVAKIATQRRLEELVGAGVSPEWLTTRANNFGFFSRVDYPYEASDHEFVIGVFGGSVAQWFALQGSGRLVEGLKESPRLGDRTVRVLCFGQGSFKQPQQLIALAYFLAIGQRFDLVVNLDGFNEVALAHLNASRQIDPTLPSSQQLLPLLGLLGEGAGLTSEYLEALLKVQRNQQRRDRLGRWLEESRSAALSLFLEHFHRRALDQLAFAAARLDELSVSLERPSLFLLNDSEYDVSEDPEKLFRESARLWARSSKAMSSMSRGAGVPYLHVLQPNQYATHRSFSERERRRALNPNSPYREAARRGYPYLLAELPWLEREGVEVVSGVHLFDEVAEPIYADSCCHYNQLGNELLADLIASRLRGLIEGP